MFAKFFIRNFAYCEFFCSAISVYGKIHSFRKNILKLIFFTNSILQKYFTKIFLKNWKKKKILEILISIFKKLKKKSVQKKVG